jgi:UDP-N-acetyl-D-mannosaminouronate:lipid I N-acetyl-D-mannosaminouronosyltransferase
MSSSVGEVMVGSIAVRAFTDMSQAVAYVFPRGERLSPGFAVAINPEKVLAAANDGALLQLLQSATLRFADGIGVILALRRTVPQAVRIPGCEFWEKLMAEAGARKVPTFLLGARQETVQRVRERLERELGVPVVAARDGYFGDHEMAAIFEQIRQSGAQFVSVAMGSPRQEKVIAQLRAQLPGLFFMGVGGTFDVFAGFVRRAPPLFRRANLEWFYRLLANPSRVGRQVKLLKYAWWLAIGRI